MNLCDAKTIKQIMTVFDIKFRKEFGQNFLINRFSRVAMQEANKIFGVVSVQNVCLPL